MNVSRTLVMTIAAALAAASLAGCASRSAGTFGASAARHPAAERAVRSSSCGTKVLDATSYDNSVYEYDQSNLAGGPCGSIRPD